VPGDPRQIHGRADNLPSPGIQMGTRPRSRRRIRWSRAFPTTREIAACWANPRGPPPPIWCCSIRGNPTATCAMDGARVSAAAPHRLRRAVVRLALTWRDLHRHQPAAPGRGRPWREGRHERRGRSSAQDRRQRRVLIGLALLFFAPLGLAFYLYYGTAGWHPGGRSTPAS
jgi:hypothetical protein